MKRHSKKLVTKKIKMIEYNEKNIKTWSLVGSRATFGLVSLELAKKVKDLMILTSDVSTSAGLDRFRKNFPDKYVNKIHIIPALLQKKFYEVKKAENINECINLLIIGGSQGAKIFDTLIKTSIIELSKRYNLMIYQQTNSNNFDDFKKFYTENDINNELFDFSKDISNFMSLSNLCISRIEIKCKESYYDTGNINRVIDKMRI